MKFRIYTDGGAQRQKDGSYISASSYMIHKDYELIDAGAVTELLVGKTHNYAEINAIAQSTKKLVEYLKAADIKEDIRIEIYSDSLLYVNSLNKWIWSWIKKAKDGIYMSSTGIVINQDLIKLAHESMNKLRKYGRVNLWHINSHVNAKDTKSLYKKFIKFNSADISFEEFMFAYLCNKKVDTAATAAINEYIKSKLSK